VHKIEYNELFKKERKRERERELHRAIRVMKEMCELIEEIKLTCNSFLIIIS